MTVPDKILLFSWSTPPVATGSSRIVQNLVRHLDDDEVVLIGMKAPRGMPVMTEATPHERYLIPCVPRFLRGERFLRLLFVPWLFFVGLWARRKHRCTQILAVFPDETFLMAAYLLSRWKRLPLTLYFHDLYSENRAGFPLGSLARRLEPRALARARCFFVANAGMREHYLERHESIPEPVVLGCGLSAPIPEDVRVPEPDVPLRIGFSGNVYTNVQDCLQALKRLLESHSDLALTLFTPASREQLEKMGVWGPRMSLEFGSSAGELLRGLGGCDVLYLPLCFECGPIDPREIASAFPIKSMDYLIAGRPVVVHCPGHYYLARFFRENEAGLVVDEPGGEALLAALRRLAAEADLRERLVRGALRAAEPFAGPQLAARMREHMELRGRA